MIENTKTGVLKQWSLEDVTTLPRNGRETLLDVRTPREYQRGHIDGFRNIPVDALRDRLGELDHEKPVYVICQSGLRSYITSRILAGNGFKVYNFTGGFLYYDTVMHERTLVRTAAVCDVYE